MNNKRKIFIGSRKSNLAKQQTALALKKLYTAGLKNIIPKHIISLGDKTSFNEFKNQGGKGLFTKEIDNLLINKNIDLAVHSAKDIPAFIDNRLTIAAYLPREDTREVLVTKNFSIKNILDINEEIKFGTSSPRRINYLKNLFSFSSITSLRGNIESRIKKVRDNKVDATLLAYAGIKRLNLKYNDIKFIKIPTSIILPAPGQGAIAIMCRKSDKEIINVCKKIDHAITRTTLNAERAFIKRINGDCFTPLAALAKINGHIIEMKGVLFSKDGKFFSEAKVTNSINNPEKAGQSCAEKVLAIYKKII